MRSHATSPRPAIESKIRRALPLLYSWYRRHHRPLPWRTRPTPYRTAVAEFMCQQTRITTVIPYYQRWMKLFPGWAQLARASASRVLRMWEGLGYYRRARFLHSLARAVVRLPGRDLPRDPEFLQKLPGIGDYTAGAIASIAFGKPAPAFDGNVARVLGRLTARHGKAPNLSALRNLAGRIVPRKNPGLHNQALMELGALICLPKLPRCSLCPLRKACPSSQLLPSSSRLALVPSRLRPTPSHQSEFILIARRQGRVWLTQTHPLGRWRGLCFFPTTLQKPHGKLALKIHYPFTRYMIHAAVYIVRQAPSQWPGKWFTSKQLRRATLPAPHRKILDTLEIG